MRCPHHENAQSSGRRRSARTLSAARGASCHAHSRSPSPSAPSSELLAPAATVSTTMPSPSKRSVNSRCGTSGRSRAGGSLWLDRRSASFCYRSSPGTSPWPFMSASPRSGRRSGRGRYRALRNTSVERRKDRSRGTGIAAGSTRGGLAQRGLTLHQHCRGAASGKARALASKDSNRS